MKLSDLRATDKGRALREMVDILHKAGRVKSPGRRSKDTSGA